MTRQIAYRPAADYDGAIPRRRGRIPHPKASKDLMARRTRRFESLEERRLLAAADHAADTSALIAAPTSSESTPQAVLAAGETAMPGAGSGSNDGSADTTPGDAAASEYSASEYGAAAKSSQGYDRTGESNSSSEYATTSARSTDSASAEYRSPTVSKLSTSTTPAADSPSLLSQASVLSSSATSLLSTPSSDASAAVSSFGAAVAIAAAGAPGGPVAFDAHDLVARDDLQEPASGGPAPAVLRGETSEIMAAVAWASSDERRGLDSLEAETALPPASNEASLLAGSSPAAGLIAGAVGADWSYFDRGIDELLDKLARFGDDLPAASAWRVGECVGLAAGAAAAFEYVRAQLREGGGWQAFADGGREPWEPRLRRRWFRRQAEKKEHS